MLTVLAPLTIVDAPRLLARAAPVAVPAGFPSPAQDYYGGPVDLNEHLIKDPVSTFIVRVSGDSMIGAGIYDGDEILVDRAIDPRPGHVVVAVVDAEFTLKRLDSRRGRLMLCAENPAYPDIEIAEGSEVSIWGVVTANIHHQHV
ncbi:LexA family protein [Agromyces sp. NPDC058104]|uniref:LexA family protein n=1 Tax=Agromyces sp. NPDC058104 TaxID=3346342 RepID=UPI0036DA4F17